MKNIILLSLSILLILTGCESSEQKNTSSKNRMELIPEPDKDLREEYEKNMLQTDSLKKEEQANKIDSL